MARRPGHIRALTATVAISTALLIAPSRAFSQSADHGGKQSAPTPKPTQTMGAMMAGRHGVMADAAAADKKLDDLVATMNAASGNAKIDAMAAVLNALAAERMQMRNCMTTMHQMAEHMMSMQNGAKSSTPADATGGHAGHQPQKH